MKWHQYLGDLFLALILVHVFSWAVYYDQVDYSLSNLLWNVDYHNDNWTITMQAWVVTIFMITHGVLTMNYVRRNYFETFYYAHHWFLALFVSTLWHANSAWYYICASLGLWVADRIMRSWSAYAEARVDSFEPLDVGGERVTCVKAVRVS